MFVGFDYLAGRFSLVWRKLLFPGDFVCFGVFVCLVVFGLVCWWFDKLLCYCLK